MIIRSPNYPNSYGHNEDCQWILESRAGNTMTVNITRFQTERTYDILRIGDGGTVGTQRAEYSGEPSVPIVIRSAGPEVWITFTSDGDKLAPGFSLSVQDNCAPSQSPYQYNLDFHS